MGILWFLPTLITPGSFFLVARSSRSVDRLIGRSAIPIALAAMFTRLVLFVSTRPVCTAGTVGTVGMYSSCSVHQEGCESASLRPRAMPTGRGHLEMQMEFAN